MRDKYIPGTISHCWDGFPCKCHTVLGDASKFGIAIQLFCDGMGTTNKPTTWTVKHVHCRSVLNLLTYCFLLYSLQAW